MRLNFSDKWLRLTPVNYVELLEIRFNGLISLKVESFPLESNISRFLFKDRRNSHVLVPSVRQQYCYCEKRHKKSRTAYFYLVLKSWFYKVLCGLVHVCVTSEWFIPCPANESFCVAPVKCGVPQGSGLGPVLFSLCMLPVGNRIQSHGALYWNTAVPAPGKLSALHDCTAEYPKTGCPRFSFSWIPQKLKWPVTGAKQFLPSAGPLVDYIRPTAQNLSICLSAVYTYTSIIFKQHVAANLFHSMYLITAELFYSPFTCLNRKFPGQTTDGAELRCQYRNMITPSLFKQLLLFCFALLFCVFFLSGQYILGLKITFSLWFLLTDK